MFYVNTCIRKVSAVPSVLVSLIPPRLLQGTAIVQRVETAMSAGRCSDYCFFIDHLLHPRGVGNPLLRSPVYLQTDIYLDTSEERSDLSRIRKGDEKFEEMNLKNYKSDFPPRNVLFLSLLEDLKNGRLRVSRVEFRAERELGSCARHKRRRARFAADRSRSCRAASTDVQIVGRLLKTNKCSLRR